MRRFGWEEQQSPGVSSFFAIEFFMNRQYLKEYYFEESEYRKKC